MKYLRRIAHAMHWAIGGIHWIVGRVLWYFLAPFVEDLCSRYTTDLIDRAELESEIQYVRSEIRSVELDMELLQGDDE